jgi:hypothetical protein
VETCLLLLGFTSWLVCMSSAFVTRTATSYPVHSHRSMQSTISAYLPTQSALGAVVYGQDGKIVKDSEQKEDMTNAFVEISSTIQQSVLSKIDNALLTRLACAFAPPPHDHLLPHRIVSASLEQINAQQCSIAVAVPTGDSGTSNSSGEQLLAQILVPVAFHEEIDTNSQDEKDVVESVVQRMQQLDSMATDRLVQREKQQQSRDQQGVAPVQQQKQSQELMEEPLAVDWPSWWTVPQLKIMLVEECNTLKSLLNEADFANDLIALCKVHYDTKSPIRQAKAASIGTSGIFLRAVVDDNLVDVPIPFPGGEARTSDDLRESVLTMIETVEAPVPAVPAEEKVESVKEPAKPAEIVAMEEETTEPVAAVEDKEEAPQEAPKEATREEKVAEARRQPKSPQEESKLAAKYAAIEDVGERAFTILKDLYMI